MSQVLYRKYRPRNFAEVVGQTPVKTILKNALKTGRVSHAYLFNGPRGVGKTTIARILAKAVNIEKLKDGDVPVDDEVSQQIDSGRFLDLIEIDAASYTGVDNIREVIEHVKFSPSQGKYKVFIIDEVHMLSKAAFNALLKTLEEPPAHAIFILATTEIHKVPATIVSRTQRFDFQHASIADILELFTRILPDMEAKISDEAQRLIAQAAQGSLRDALSILDQVLSFSDDDISLTDVENILGVTRLDVHQRLLSFVLSGNSKEAVSLVRDLSFEGKDMVQFLKDFLEYLRLVMLFKMGVEDRNSTGLLDEEVELLEKQASEISGQMLVKLIGKAIAAYRDAGFAPMPELPVLVYIMEVSEQTNKTTTEIPAERESKPRPQDSAKADSQSKPEKTPTSSDEEAESQQQTSQTETTNQSQLTENVELGALVDRWSEVLKRVKQYNHSLISSLRLGRLVKVESGTLYLAFPYSFHKDTVAQRKNRIVIEQVLQDVFDAKVQIEALVEREIDEQEMLSPAKDTDNNTGDDLVNEAMRILGANS